RAIPTASPSASEVARVFPPATSAGRTAAPATPAAPVADLGTYVSLTDNEWTVVALLSPDAPASTEEPSLQHAPGPTWTPDGPYLVLQQGLIPTAASEAAAPEVVCAIPADPRDQPAVHLPAGRVAYLGITFPGMAPAARVTATLAGYGLPALRRAAPVVRLGGTSAGLYALPGTGPGGAVLYVSAPPGMLPSTAYRFEIVAPEPVGHRYLYACVGS
ncbi:MAG TPA: hypothetical protein VMH24_05775, partial [Candidatus Sulfotelmatobacter sp.]|nr:hypothetical protein [Candidatus Sulfotelmatobacter sp.]